MATLNSVRIFSPWRKKCELLSLLPPSSGSGQSTEYPLRVLLDYGDSQFSPYNAWADGILNVRSLSLSFYHSLFHESTNARTHTHTVSLSLRPPSFTSPISHTFINKIVLNNEF